MQEMDKTIRPIHPIPESTRSILKETVGPNAPLTFHDIINSETSFLVYKKGKVEEVNVGGESIIHIGKSRVNEIVIDEPGISDTQVTIIKMGEFMYFMDSGASDLVSFNGVKRRQLIVDPYSRVVIKIANTWVIYGNTNKNYSTTEGAQSEFLLKVGDDECFSDNDPLLIGSHPSCDLTFKDENLQSFHAIVYFSDRGLLVEDLTSGKPGIVIEGMKSIGARPVKTDTVLNIGKAKVNLYIYGEVKEHCQHMFNGFTPQPLLAFTNLGLDLPAVPIPKTNERLSVGRQSTANIIIPDPSVSRVHAYILVKDKYLQLADNNSFNKTYVNRKPISKAIVKPGDIVEFGDTPFLIHFA